MKKPEKLIQQVFTGNPAEKCRQESCLVGYNKSTEDWENYISYKLDIDVLSSIIYHVLSEEGVLDFCEKDCNAIAKAIRKEILP